MEVEATLRVLRLARGLAVRAVAAAVGVSTGTVSRWESGEFSPSSQDGERYAAVLEIGQAELNALLEQAQAARASRKAVAR